MAKTPYEHYLDELDRLVKDITALQDVRLQLVRMGERGRLGGPEMKRLDAAVSYIESAERALDRILAAH